MGRTEIRDNPMVPPLLLLTLLVSVLTNALPKANPTPDPDIHIHLHSLGDAAATATTVEMEAGNDYAAITRYLGREWCMWDWCKCKSRIEEIVLRRPQPWWGKS